MRFLCFVLCLLPLAWAAPDKRFIEALFGTNAFDLTVLKCDIQLMLDVLGSDPSENACEKECHVLLIEGHVLNYGCPLVCKGFQALVHQWHLVPEHQDPSVDPCASKK